MKFIKYVLIFLIGLIITDTSFAQIPVMGPEYELMLRVPPSVTLSINNSSIDFAYHQLNGFKDDLDLNRISVLSNCAWTLNILADDNLLRHPAVGDTVDINDHKIKLEQWDASGPMPLHLTSVGDLSKIVPIVIIGSGDIDLNVAWRMDMSALSSLFLPAGQYSTGISYSVVTSP